MSVSVCVFVACAGDWRSVLATTWFPRSPPHRPEAEQLRPPRGWGCGVWCLVSAVPGTDSTGRTGYGCRGRAGLDGATPRRAQRPSRRSRLPHVLPPPPGRPPRQFCMGTRPMPSVLPKLGGGGGWVGVWAGWGGEGGGGDPSWILGTLVAKTCRRRRETAGSKTAAGRQSSEQWPSGTCEESAEWFVCPRGWSQTGLRPWTSPVRGVSWGVLRPRTLSATHANAKKAPH